MTEGSLTFIGPQSFCCIRKMYFIHLIFLLLNFDVMEFGLTDSFWFSCFAWRESPW